MGRMDPRTRRAAGRSPAGASSIRAALTLVAAWCLTAPAGGPAAGAPPGPSGRALKVRTHVSETTNLIHWVDNLAGSSIGKTAPTYRRYWQQRFGGFDMADRAALDAFARIRNLPLPSPASVANASGCLPIEDGTLEWPERFMAEAMAARSVDRFVDALSDRLDGAQIEDLRAALDRFAPRFHRIWRDMDHVHRFDRRFRRYLEDSDLPGFLEQMARFFGVSGSTLPTMHISFIALPDDGVTHAEADGDRLLVEIRPSDTPVDQVPVVVHETAHFLMRWMTPDQTDTLARQAFGAGEAGGLAWRLIWEGLPTAIGQGIARARFDPRRFSADDPWYHLATIDRFAKMTYPSVAEAMKRSVTLHDGLMPRFVEMIRRSGLGSRIGMRDWLSPSFFAAGEGMDLTVHAVRRRLGVRLDAATRLFPLDDAQGDDWLRRYACVPGLAIVSESELARAARLGDERLLGEEEIRRVAAYLAEGRAGVLAVGRRRAGGAVFFLVPREAGLADDLVGGFARLRGVPGGMIPFGPPSRENSRPMLGPGAMPEQHDPGGKMLY